MRYIVITFIGLLLASCSVRQMSEGRTKRNLDRMDRITADILKLNMNRFIVDSLDNTDLKRNLKKVNAKRVEVFNEEHHELGQDSVIVLSRHNFMLTFGEVFIDFKKEKRDLTGMIGLKKVGTRTYFRKKTLPVS